MSHKNSGALLVALTASLLAACTAGAAPFEASFTIIKITGTCELQTPAMNAFAAAADGQACTYGTIIRTGNGSSCIISFSEDNGCLVCQNTTVRIDENEKDKKSKILRVSEGEVEFNLEKNFRKRNRLSVETPSAICEAMACTCSTDFRIIGDLKTSTFRCSEGDVEIRGDYFSITDFGGNDQVTVAETPNNNFIRIKAVKGDITPVVRDENGTERKVSLTAGDELTIMASDSPTDPSKIEVVYKVTYADPQKAALPPWQHTFAKPTVAPPTAPETVAGPTPPLPSERKWSNLTVGPPIPPVTPVGKP